MVLEPKRTITYGPVDSRRLGRSLGVNLFPGARKVCSLDCLYCQYGRTRCFEAGPSACGTTVDEVEEAVVGALGAVAPPPAWITFSGNGEPTVHPRFAAMVERVIEVRDRECPTARTAVLSNSTTVHRQEIRTAIARLDARIMKLDCGTEAAFRTFNRPAAGVSFEALLEGLAAVEDLTIQALLAGGPRGNASLAELVEWRRRVVELAPRQVQVYTLDRPVAARGLDRLDPAALEEQAAALRAAGIEATAYCR
jgi:wyosine [tRNA(Phe)-imidazoG37] synthetase (radical SAM superfamily)